MPDRARSDRPESRRPLLDRARALIARGHPEAALELARQAIARNPADTLVRAIAHHAFSDGIAGFHADMLHDAARTRVYAEAIARHAPGRRVLDIGTGSALLAMMAARTGAERVYACEADPRLAMTAREIVAANGLSDRIVILPSHSARLKAADLDGGVDLVLSELFSQDLLGEGLLPTLADARRRLCLPGAIFLPDTASVRVALADCGQGGGTIDAVAGFDLAPFNRHVPAHEGVRQGRQDVVLRSEPADLFAFDLAGPIAVEATARCPMPSRGGRVTGVIQWIRFETAPGLAYENAPAPGHESSHWVMLHHRLPQPVMTAPGDCLTVHGWYAGETLLVWCGA